MGKLGRSMILLGHIRSVEKSVSGAWWQGPGRIFNYKSQKYENGT